MSIILKNGTIITSKEILKKDLRIDEQKISEIGFDLGKEEDEIIDINGCIVIPGGIDTHTHFDMNAGEIKTSDDFKTGTKAAILGGTTTIIDFAEAQDEENLGQAFNSYMDKAQNKSYCDYAFHMTITQLNESTLQEMEKLVDKGVTSFKLYMAYKDVLQVDDGIIYKILEKAKQLGCVVAVHCENGDLLDVFIKEQLKLKNIEPKYHPITRPNLLEKEAISRLIDITKLTNSNSYVVHLSTKEGLEEIKKAKENNINIIAETCPQYLLLDDRLYNKSGFESAKYVLSPPLRSKNDQEQLWRGIREGYIDTIGTDHCSFNYKGQKELGINDFSKIPNGIPGVEHRMLLMYTYGVLENKIDINKFVQITSTNAAKTFGMYPKKGEIALGSDADLVVINPNEGSVITSDKQNQAVDYTPYEGFEIKCKIKHVFLRGKCAVKNGELVSEKSNGKYINRKTRG